MGVFIGRFGLLFGIFGIRKRLFNGIKAIQAQLGHRAVVFGLGQGLIRCLIAFLRCGHIGLRRFHRLLFFFVFQLGIQGALGIVKHFLRLTQRIGSLFFGLGVRADARRGAVIGSLDLIILCFGIVVGILGIVLVVLGILQIAFGTFEVFVGLADFILQVDQIVFVLHGGGVQVLHRPVIAGLGALHAVGVALPGRGDLLLQVLRVQHGDHIAFFHLIAHRYAHLRNLVVLGRIGHGNAGLAAGLHGAVHTYAVGKAAFLQRGGAHKLIG